MWTHPEPHPGAYLKQRFLDPLGISVSELARTIGVPKSRISEIVSGRRRISADTAVRLGAFFDLEPMTWMQLQCTHDLAQLTEPAIDPIDPPGFLVTPIGLIATAAVPRRPRPTMLKIDQGVRERMYRAATEREPLLAAEPELVRYPGGAMAFESRARRSDEV